MARLVILTLFVFFALGNCELPRGQRPQTGDDAALKQFLMKHNRMPYPNENISISNSNSSTPHVAQPKVKDWTTCEGCKLLVTELRSIIKNPQEVAKLKELLSRMCNLGILSHYKAECLNMVDNLVAVLHEIEPILDNPTAVCQELQYCPESLRGSITPSKHLALLLGLKFVEALHPGRTNDVACDECIFAVSELKSLVQSASIQAELKQELHKLCRMAGQYETECSALVDQYFSLLIQELVQLLADGRQVCVDIGFCNATGASSTSIPLTRIRPAGSRQGGRVQMDRVQASTLNIPHLKNFAFTLPRLQTREGLNAGCLVCEAALTTVADLLSQEQVAAAVASDLTNFMCALVPTTMKSGCTDFMKIYSRAIITAALTRYTPAQICSAVGACKPEDERRIQQLNSTAKAAAVCEACQLVSQYLSFEFQQPDFQKEVIGIMKNACTLLPGDYKNQCEDSLQNYVPPTLAFLADYLSRNVVCATLKMCPGQQVSTA